MPAKTSPEDFAALVRRSGLPLSEVEQAEIYLGWTHLEAMLERLRMPLRPREVEPAVTFRPDGAAS
ncbi:MAG: hypothetical protein KGJ41_08500 [Rhodospirillales bacterium]|nr:hypothetical protein [Rhodospirillales bacterium]MDE2199049.1 hypothetical protein [Rhodospirillales bacterium]MDE2575743.1 hypothetical protein [Rhodospirillales bacterium]